MKISALVVVILSLLLFSVCWANEASLEKAYSLYYKGDKDAAISMAEAYVEESPDANAFYFLGYAYYEMQEMDKAREYFDEAYSMKSFFSPIPSEKDE